MKNGFTRWWRSVGHAWHGLLIAWRSEPNLKIHLVMLVLTAGLALLLGFSEMRWAVLALIWGLVIVTELLNTAVEKMADIVQPERDERVKAVKDIAAGAVLIAALTAIVGGGCLFVPLIIEHLFE